MPAEHETVLRPATTEDAAVVAEVYLASRALAAMPPGVHTDEEVRGFLAGRVADPAEEVWVAEVDGAVVAYLRMTETWLDDLYVHPDHAGAGLGGALLDVAKARRPDGFSLWVFEVNTPAQRFYARHGLVEVLRTDGAENEEKAPDLQLAWRP